MKFKNEKRLQEELSVRCSKVSWHGHYFSALCVFHHNIDTPAMFVYPDFFICKSCNEQGPLQKLQRKLEGTKATWYDGDEPVRVVPEWKEYLKEFGSYNDAARQAHKTAKEYPVLMRYLKERKLEQLVDDEAVGYLKGWLSFPVFNERGKMVDWVLRSTPGLETDVKYATRPRKTKTEGFHLYCADWKQVFSGSEIYIPFGILDMHTLHYAGYPSATGLTGKSYKVEWFDKLRKRIWLIPDKQEEEDAYKFARSLGWRAKVLLLDYPDEIKDANGILMSGSLDDVRIAIETAKEKHGK